MNQTVGEALAAVPARLPGETPGQDAQVLLARLLSRPRSWVLAHPEAPLTRRLSAVLEAWVERLEGGEPLPYLLGEWEFFGLTFEVAPAVLIPRPETELLVERAIAWLASGRPEGRPPRAIDVGTGSGCIAVALAVRLPGLQVAATDLSPAALEVARRNAARHGVSGRIEFGACDLFPPGEGGYDLIAANLPYIPTAALRKLPVSGREPDLALDGGADGLAVIRRLLAAAPERLLPGGLLLMEIEASQGPSVLSLACDAFFKAEIHLHKDLAGHDRLLEIRT